MKYWNNGMIEKTAKIAFPDVKKILIRSANWVGDVVMSLPAITSVRKTFPRAEISILAKPWVADILQNNSIIDRVILYQSPGIHQGIPGKWRLARELKKDKFELALLLQNAFEAALISYLAGIPSRAGYNTDGRGLLLTHPVQRTKDFKKRHQVDYYLELVKNYGFHQVKRIPVLEITDGHKREAKQKLKSLNISDNEKLVGISPGATYGPAKQWFPERYGRLADKIAKNLGARVLIFGSHSDKKIALQVCQNARGGLIDLTGSTTLAQAMALIARCRLFITNDSGLMHVAAALQVPLIAVFGSTDPQRTGPLGEACLVLSKPVPCAPCLKSECPDRRQCLDLISVDEVYEEVKKIWIAQGLSFRA